MANLHDIVAQDLETAVFDTTLPESPAEDVILIDLDENQHPGIAAILSPVEVDLQDNGNGEVHVFTRTATIMTTGTAGFADPRINMHLVIDSEVWKVYGVSNLNEVTAELQIVKDTKISKHHENHLIRNI